MWGQYHNIFILDPNTLEVLLIVIFTIIIIIFYYLQFICALKSSHNPNWISQLCFIPNIDKNGMLNCICSTFMSLPFFPLISSVLFSLSLSFSPLSLSLSPLSLSLLSLSLSSLSPLSSPLYFSLPLSLSLLITDAMIAITVDGTLKVWLIHTNIEMKEMTDLFEERSKALGLTNPLSLSSESIADFSLALVVCKDSWQVHVHVHVHVIILIVFISIILSS